MIVREGIEHPAPVDSPVLIELPADRMGDLKIIVVVVTGPESLVELIVCDRMAHLAVRPAGIIAVDHLAHQPEGFFLLSGYPAHLLQEIKIQAVRAVQADAVDIKFADPETDHVKQIILHRPVIEIQIDQIAAVSPAFIGKTVVKGAVPAEINSFVPVFVGGILPLFLYITESEELPPGVVEHAVHHNPDTGVVQSAHKAAEVFIVSQPAVHGPVVRRVIAVGGRLKQRADIDRPDPERFQMPDPVLKFRKSVNHIPAFIHCRSAQQAKGIDVIENYIIIPIAHCQIL